MGLRINDTIPNLTVETDHGTFSLNDWLIDSVRHHKADEKNAYRTSYYKLVRRKFRVEDHPVVDGIPVEMRVTNSRATKVTR